MRPDTSSASSPSTEPPAVRAIVPTGGEQVSPPAAASRALGAAPIEIMRRHTKRVWAPIRRCPKPVIQSALMLPGPKKARICTMRPSASKRIVSMGRMVVRRP